MLNRFELIGRIGNELNIKKVGGNSCLNLNMATDKVVLDGETYKKDTAWVPVTFWGKKAEIINQYCSKGKLIYVEGSIEQKRKGDEYKTYITGRDFKFLSKKDAAENGATEQVENLEEIPF